MADASKKSYYEDVIKDAGLDPVTSEELQSKFDAITKAEYDKQRTDLQTATNKYYNQLYDTQQTTMDTIRQANAQAVASGASKGVQAANELSALLGLQSEAVTGATDLANQATTLAQDESQAMLENMLNAETQAAAQNQALAQILTQAGSVDVEKQNADTAKQQVLQNYWDKYLQAKADGNTEAADQILEEMANYSTNNTDSTQDSEKVPVSEMNPKDMNIEQLKEALKNVEGRTGTFEDTVRQSLSVDLNSPFPAAQNPALVPITLNAQLSVKHGITIPTDKINSSVTAIDTIRKNNDLTQAEKQKRINEINADLELYAYREYYKKLKG